MYIPTDKIEDWSVRELQKLADETTAIVPELETHDKGMSYDGWLWLFKKNSPHDKKSFEDKISVQIKGHIDDEGKFINKKRISYSVDVEDLRVYSQKEGVVYFQVFVTSNRNRQEVFYATLYSSRIKSYLQEVKENQKSKSITFTKMKKTGEELYLILKQFSKESKEQGSIHTVTVKNMIPLNEIASLKEVHFEAIGVKNEFDLLRRLSAGDICIYGKICDAPYRFPIEWNDSNKFFVSKRIQISIKVNGIEYYNSIEAIRNSDEDVDVVKFSDNLSFEIETNRFAFRAVSNIEEINNDVSFLRAVIKNKNFQFSDQIQNVPNIDLSNELDVSLRFFEDLDDILTNAKVRIDKRFENLDSDEIKAFTKIVEMKRGGIKITFPEKVAHYDWKFGDKYIPLLVEKKDDGSCDFRNAIYDPQVHISVTNDEQNYFRVLGFGYLKKEVVENLYVYDSTALLSALSEVDVNEVTRDALNNAVLRLIQAYDVSGDVIILEGAQILCKQIQNGSNLYRINELQIKVRLHELSSEDIRELDEIIHNSDSIGIEFAARILKGETVLARKLFQKMDEDERRMIVEWPIYKLLDISNDE